MKKADLMDMFKKASKSGSYSNFFSYMKTPENTGEEPNDPEPVGEGHV
jgi:hypothetical protein